MKTILCGVLLAALASCTTVREDGRRTLHWLDAHLTPDSATVRWCLLPVVIPVGVVGVLSDTLVVNPVCAIDDAWADTVDVLWTSHEESPLRKALFTPLAVLGTPIVFPVDWLWRCLLPIAPRKDDPSEGGGR